MSEAKHTPGPWIYTEDEANEGWYNVGTHDDPTAVIGIEGLGGHEPDARLIASAPDLLEALEGLDVLLEKAWKAQILPACAIPTESVAKYRAAIAKARGEA